MERRFWIIPVAVVIVASLPRVWGLFDDFWLDEIWSYTIAGQMRSTFDVLTSEAARIDNNHPLNTLCIWLSGQQRYWPVYRTPALLAGVGSIVLLGVALRRIGQLEAILAASLIGFSFPLIVLSSEARGYSPAVFLAILAFVLADQYLRHPRWGLAGGFGVSCLLGLLSHLTFIHVYAGLLVWSIYRLVRAAPPRVAGLNALRLHALPLAGCIWLYLTFIRHLRVGGTSSTPEWMAAIDAICSLLLMPGALYFELLVVIFSAFGLVWAARRAGDRIGLFLVVAMVVSPVLVLARQAMLLDDHQAIAPRYFVVLLPLFFMVLARPLATAFRAGGWRRAAAALLLVAWLAVNGWQTIQFLLIGRGHYADAVRFISANTPGDEIRVLSDHPTRTTLVLDFYRRLLPVHQRMSIQDYSGEPSAADWIVMHDRGHGPPQVTSFTDRAGARWVLAGTYPYYGPSGYTWYLYRRVRGQP